MSVPKTLCRRVWPFSFPPCRSQSNKASLQLRIFFTVEPQDPCGVGNQGADSWPSKLRTRSAKALSGLTIEWIPLEWSLPSTANWLSAAVLSGVFQSPHHWNSFGRCYVRVWSWTHSWRTRFRKSSMNKKWSMMQCKLLPVKSWTFLFLIFLNRFFYNQINHFLCGPR